MGVALAGLGHALLPEDESMTHIESGKLVRALADWCPKSLFMLIGSRDRAASPRASASSASWAKIRARLLRDFLNALGRG